MISSKARIRQILIITVCILLCLASVYSNKVYADDAAGSSKAMGAATGFDVDTSARGSISIHEKYGQGISFTLYKIAEFSSDGVAYYTSEFASYAEELSISPEDAESGSEIEQLTQDYVTIIESHSLSPSESSKSTDADGNVTFTNLVPGYYIVVADSFSTDDGKTYSASPILIALPGSDGESAYNISIESKSEFTEKPDTPPETPEEPPTPNKPRLPNTGALWWPVPVLLVSGATLYGIGYIIELRKNRREAK